MTKPAQIVSLRLSDIDVDHYWNYRVWKKDDAFKRLVESVQVDGLLTPVLVRRNPKPKPRKPYSLVCGFSRFEAVSQIATKSKAEDPTILAEIRPMNEAESRRINILANNRRFK